ncbi:uncharacterized protein LOC129291685 isoform X2 [Prosopis cineraria]|nr:uncharacterized protein LOC129291685 isoform X2 [Prosopis cineraria]
MGLEPKEQILIFRGKEKQDREHLHLEGVKDNSELFLFEDPASKGRKLEETRKVFDMSGALEAVAGVRTVVDQLSERMAAIEVAVKWGTDVAENEFLTLSELLMRQLLKLDSIQAEGEARLQRKAEVCRVQSIVDRLDSLKEMNSKPSSNNVNAFRDRNEGTIDSGMGSMNVPPPMPSSGELIQDLEQLTCSENGEYELRSLDEARDPSLSEALVRRRGKRLDLGAPVQEGTEIGATSGANELEQDPLDCAQPDFHINSSYATGDARPQIEGDLQGEVSPQISRLPETRNDETLANGSFLFSRIQSLPVRASTSGDSLEEDTYVNVGEILQLILPSPAVTRASANVSTNVAKSVAVLCELDDKATKLMEIAFNKYPNLMIIRSDRRKTFIRWMFCSLSNLLQLLSTTSPSTLDAPKMSEIEVVLGELETFGFDAGFIDEMRLQVSEAWETQSAIDNATSELKTLCAKAEDLNQEIASMEHGLAAAKAEVAQVENRISTLCELVEENRTPIVKWIE